MTAMPAMLPWSDFLLRLALTLVATLLLGYNRTEHGKAAGLCTSVLVGVAAAVAMMQVNALLPTAGRTPDSFVMNDLMRLPLGILTGVGFIGAGAIVRRGDIVVGVTMAATIWLVTVIGLALGGGQIVLGLAATALGLFALWVVKWFEGGLRREHRSRLELQLDAQGPGSADILTRLREHGLTVTGGRTKLTSQGRTRMVAFTVRAMRSEPHPDVPAFLAALAAEPGVAKLGWQSPA